MNDENSRGKVQNVRGDSSGISRAVAHREVVRVPGVFLYDLKDGLIARERRIYDFTALLIQIGLLKAKPAD